LAGHCGKSGVGFDGITFGLTTGGACFWCFGGGVDPLVTRGGSFGYFVDRTEFGAVTSARYPTVSGCFAVRGVADSTGLGCVTVGGLPDMAQRGTLCGGAGGTGFRRVAICVDPCVGQCLTLNQTTVGAGLGGGAGGFVPGVLQGLSFCFLAGFAGFGSAAGGIFPTVPQCFAVGYTTTLAGFCVGAGGRVPCVGASATGKHKNAGQNRHQSINGSFHLMILYLSGEVKNKLRLEQYGQ
jgi:hypothetical protein